MMTYTPDDKDTDELCPDDELALLDSIYYSMYPASYTGSFTYRVPENPEAVHFTEWFAEDYTFRQTLYSKTNENEWLTITYPDRPQYSLR